ncbi:AMP-dependent synthetase/ligase [Streptomyces sp. NPDC053048]|uniref:AMP-dependent synthetase/ligase n=1 Tax=Streptomyces sp. NPDC053048 TaxID=3365694 RepID=UPI0037D95748
MGEPTYAPAPGIPAGHLRRALDAPTVVDAFDLTARVLADRPALCAPGREPYTWARYRAAARHCAAGLARLGTRPGDTLGLLLGNRPEFHIVDAAAMTLGVTTCSLYPTASDEELRYTVDDSRMSVLVCDEPGRERAAALLRDCPRLRLLVVVDGAGGPDARVRPLAELLDTPVERGPAPRSTRPDDVLTLVYTSGTTGPPKGVELTHAAVRATGRAFLDRVPLEAGSRLVSYLPMAHIAERCCSHYLPMVLGADVTCCPEADRLFAVLPGVRPHWLFSVPRVWEKLHARLLTELGRAPEDFRHGALRALELGGALADGGPVQESERAEYDRLDGTHLAPVRALLGLDEARFVHVGAAPVRGETMRFLRALGLPAGEIWGMTELCAAACVTVPGRYRPGWIGPPLPGVELRTAPDGEVLVRGPLTMRGYRGRPRETAAVLDEQGWLRTGDLGEVAADGSLRITGRKKELIVSAYGRNMAPARIEECVSRGEPLIDQVCVIGDGRPYNVALITVRGDADPGTDMGIDIDTDRIRVAVARGNRRLSRPERIRRFAVVGRAWTPPTGLVTPTLKMRRRRIEHHYRQTVDELYADGGLTPLEERP